jgi:sporulation protein YlmC with PRC-barrel domain
MNIEAKRMETMTLKDITKKEIVTSDGFTIGEIEGVIVTTKGNIRSLSLRLNKDVVSGLKTKPNLNQDIEVEHIDGITDKVILNKPLKGLENHLQKHNEKYDAKRLIGMDVMDTKGDTIGTVEDFMIENKTWNVPSLRIKVNSGERDALKMKSIRLGGKDIAVSLNRVRDVGDMVVLNITADHLNNILEAPAIRKP